jgi:hypothetical protein
MKKTHRFMSWLLAFCLCFAVAVPTFAAEKNTKDSSIAIYLGGEKQAAVGYLVNNRTIVPLRDICDLLKIPIDYEAKTKKINVLVNNDVYILQLNSKDVFCNGKLVEKLDVSPEIRNGKTYLPLRYIAELLNIEVLWNNNSVQLSDSVIQNGILQKYFAGSSAITIPDEVIEIADNVFWGSHLTSVQMPVGLKKIGFAAFYGNDFQNIIIPDTVNDIGAWAFNTCTSLETVSLPTELTCLRSGIFQQTSIKTLVIPQNVINIEDYIFNENPKQVSPWYTPIELVVIPPNVTEIDANAFAWCEDITLVGLKGSYAETWSNQQNVSFKAISEQELQDYYN